MFYGSIVITSMGKDSLGSVCIKEILMSWMLIYRFSSVKRPKSLGFVFWSLFVCLFWFCFILFDFFKASTI